MQIDDSAVSNLESKHSEELNSDISVVDNSDEVRKALENGNFLPDSDENKIVNESIEPVENMNSERLLNAEASINNPEVDENEDNLVAVVSNESKETKAENSVEAFHKPEVLELPESPVNQLTDPPVVEKKSEEVVNEQLVLPEQEDETKVTVPKKNRKY